LLSAPAEDVNELKGISKHAANKPIGHVGSITKGANPRYKHIEK
jgi:hypothetical protein